MLKFWHVNKIIHKIYLPVIQSKGELRKCAQISAFASAYMFSSVTLVSGIVKFLRLSGAFRKVLSQTLFLNHQISHESKCTKNSHESKCIKNVQNLLNFKIISLTGQILLKKNFTVFWFIPQIYKKSVCHITTKFRVNITPKKVIWHIEFKIFIFNIAYHYTIICSFFKHGYPNISQIILRTSEAKLPQFA